MDAKTLAALHGSVRKWIAIVEWRGEDEGCRNCPLCTMFFDNDCEGCPVRRATGLVVCEGSPYADWALATNVKYPDDPRVPFDKASQRLAEEEALFLISLLPEAEQAQYFIRDEE